MIVPYEKRPQEYMGIAVIQREPAYAKHPHPSQNGRMVPTIGVTQVLLANDHEFFECDLSVGGKHCPRQSTNAQSMVAHLTSHNPNKKRPMYDEGVLRTVLRVAAEERARGIRGYAARASERLNATHVERIDGKPWNSGVISHLWTDHHEKYGPQRIRRTQQVVQPGGQRRRSAPANPNGTANTDAAVSLAHVLRKIDELRAEVVALSKLAPDAETVRKAGLYDAIMAHAQATSQ
jgi:hypothetical protein